MFAGHDAEADAGLAGQGEACIAWLDALHFARPAGPAPDAATCEWLRTTVGAEDGEGLVGLDPGEADDDTFQALRDVGAPLAPAGALRWGREVALDPDRVEPGCRDGRLLVPPSPRLRACTGVELVALRRWFGDRLGLRLQAAPRIACYLWPDRALLVSRRSERLAGFLLGPGPDRRHHLAWEPGQALLVRW